MKVLKGNKTNILRIELQVQCVKTYKRKFINESLRYIQNYTSSSLN